MSTLYDELMELAIMDESTEEYKERRSLQEGAIGTILKTIGIITVGPYVVMLPIAIIIAVVLKIQGKKKEKIFKMLSSTPEFKSYTSKLIKEIQTNIAKETKYSKYLKNNSLETLNNSTADITNNYKCLVIKNIISYDIEKVWKDKVNMGSLDYNNKNNDNPDEVASIPKEVKEVTKDIKNAINSINKNTDKFSIDFSEDIDDGFYYSFDKDDRSINLYIKIEHVKEVDEYFKNNK